MAAKKKEATIDEELSREEREEGGVTVDLTDPDEEEVDPEPEGPRPPTRKEKKQARGTLRDEAEALRERNAQLERENAETRARAAEAAGYAQGMRQAVGGGQKDPLDAELEEIDRQNDELVALAHAKQKAGQLTDAEEADLRRRARGIQNQRGIVLAKKALRESQPNDQQRALEENNRQMLARYPDIVSNRQALTWAMGRYQTLVAEGHQGGWTTTDLVMNEARARWSPGAKVPDPTLGRKLQAEPRGSSGGSSGGGGNTVQLTKKDVEMADVMYDRLPPKERYKAYAKFLASKKSA